MKALKEFFLGMFSLIAFSALPYIIVGIFFLPALFRTQKGNLTIFDWIVAHPSGAMTIFVFGLIAYVKIRN